MRSQYNKNKQKRYQKIISFCNTEYLGIFTCVKSFNWSNMTLASSIGHLEKIRKGWESVI